MKAPKMFQSAAILIAAALVFASPLAGQGKGSADQVLTPRTFIDLAKKVRPSVVSIKINVETREAMERWRRERQAQPRQPRPDDAPEIPDWLKEFFDLDPRMMPRSPEMDQDWFRFPYGAGTGMIIREDGYILTNRHVLYHPMFGKMFKDGQITVVLADKREFKGDQVKLVATDLLTDLAVLKVEAKNLTPVTWANSEEAEIGEWVIAVGDPLELTGSVSQGIISGMGREIEIAGYARLLQTTAVINPGNSGGPLVNLDGEVVGINNAIASNTRYWQGVGFAIPSSLAEKISNDLIEAGHPVRGYIGIRMTDPTEFPALAKHEKYDGESGVGIVEVYKGYPAEKAGLKPYDILVEINGKDVSSNVSVQRAVTAVRPGDRVRVKVFRDGKFRTLTVNAGEWPTEEELAALTRRTSRMVLPGAEEEESKTGELGLSVENHPDNPDASEDDKGVIVRQVREGSAAADAGLRVGDIIVEAEKQRVHNIEEFAEIVKKRRKEFRDSEDKESETILLKARRGNEEFLAFLPLTAK